ncbi:MAG: crossover junction endodeoxyribonuclease RuvC [Patescibacteria group bacterium]
MRILGIDPGTQRLGWGVIESQAGKVKASSYGCITTVPKQNHGERLVYIFDELTRIIGQEKPQVLAIEKLFFIKNVTTAMTVSEARGVVILACKQAGLEIFEYTPLQIKMGLTGYGKAEKSQIQMMVKMILGLTEVPKPDDVADALAVAITHINSAKVYVEKKI